MATSHRSETRALTGCKTPLSRRTKVSGQRLLTFNSRVFSSFPHQQKHRRQTRVHQRVCPQEKQLPNLHSPLSGEEEMGPRRSPSPEMLVALKGARPMDHHTPRTSLSLPPLLLRCSASEQVWVSQPSRKAWLSGGGRGARPEGRQAVTRSSAASFSRRLSFEERDGKVLVSAGRLRATRRGEKRRTWQVTKQSGGPGWMMQQNQSSQNGIITTFFFFLLFFFVKNTADGPTISGGGKK